MLLFGLVAFVGQAQELHFQTYSVDEGLTHSEVSKVFQDSRGFIWCTTNGGGVSRFDGSEFVNWDTQAGLSHNIVRGIAEDSLHNIWFGTLGGGLNRFDGTTFTHFDDSLLDGSVNFYSLTTDFQGNVWCGSDSGIYKYDNETWTHFAADVVPRAPVIATHTDGKGNVWFGVDQAGLYRYDGEQFSVFSEADGLSFNNVLDIYEDRHGTIWVGTFDGLTRLIPEGDSYKVIPYKYTEGFTAQYVFTFAEDRFGQLWMGTQNHGMGRWVAEEERVEFMDASAGAPSALAFNILSDNEQNLWVCFWGHGITKYTDQRFVTYREEHGLNANLTGAIIGDDNGFLVATGKGISQFDGQEFSTLDSTHLWGQVNVIFRDSRGDLWAGQPEGILRYHNGEPEVFLEADSIPLDFVRRFTEDSEGNIWICTWNNGMIRFDGESFRRYDHEDGVDSYFFYTSFTDTEGNVWFGSWGAGVTKYDLAAGGTFTGYSLEEGLSSDKVSAIGQDDRGNMWFGTYGAGVNCFVDDSFHHIGVADGLVHGAVLSILPLDDYLWVTTIKGIDRIDLKQFYADGRIAIKHYGAREGYKEEALFNTSYADDNYIWIGTKNGVVRFDPSQDLDGYHPPKCILTGLDLFYKSTDWSAYGEVDPFNGMPDQLSLKPKDNRLTFRFLAIHTTAPEDVRFQYRLDGLDTEWSPQTTKREVTYHGLAPGAYTFRVKAVLGDQSSKEQVFSFSILPPFWQTWWFLLLCVITALLGFYAVLKVRERNHRRTKRILMEKVQKRTEHIERQKEIIETKNKDITDSIHYAKRIQEAILPPLRMVKEYLPESFVLYRPKDIVSGDFYWVESFASSLDVHHSGADDTSDAVENFSSKTVFFAAVDCTGHGVPGAMVSVMGANGLNRCVKEFGLRDPAEILDRLAELVEENFERSENEVRDGMDIALCSLEQSPQNSSSHSILKYAGANNPLWIIRKGAEEIEVIRADKQPIGKYADRKPFTTHTIELQQGDSVYVFSDGYSDQFGGSKNKKLKSGNFKQLLLAQQDQPMERQMHKLGAFFDDWKGVYEQVDDVCVIGVRV